MSRDEIFNKLCEIFFAEEVRLEARIDMLQHKLKHSDFDRMTMIEYIQAVAERDYFRKYMLDILRHLKFFQ